MIKNIFRSTWSFVVLPIFGICLVIFLFKDSKNLYNEYDLCDAGLSFNGRVTEVKKRGSVLFVLINDQEKICFSPSSNKAYHPIDLDSNLFVGDSILKQTGSDTIRIFRKNEYFVFVHDAVIERGDIY